MVLLKFENKLLSKSFSLSVVSGLLVLSACSGAGVTKDYGIVWNDATVSEKGLNDAGCKFVERVTADGSKTEDLVCDEAATPQAAAKREAALNSYSASAKLALETPNLKPTSRMKLVFRDIKVQSLLTKIQLKAVQADAEHEVQRANAMKLDTARTLMKTYSSLLTAKEFGCKFEANNDFVCSKSVDEIAASNQYQNFKSYLSSLSASQKKVLALDSNLSKEERQSLEAKKASLDAFLEDINCRDCAH